MREQRCPSACFVLADLQTERVLHLTSCAGDHKHQGNYRIKDATEISVKDHLWYSKLALKLSAPCESVAS